MSSPVAHNIENVDTIMIDISHSFAKFDYFGYYTFQSDWKGECRASWLCNTTLYQVALYQTALEVVTTFLYTKTTD